MHNISYTKQSFQSNKYYIMSPQHHNTSATYADFLKESQTIPKNKILNWLYSTDRHVSLEKFSHWLEDNTDGQYRIIKSEIKLLDKDCA